MNHYQAYACGIESTLITEGFTQSVEHFLIAAITELVSSQSDMTTVTVLCDRKLAFQLRCYAVAGQHYVSVKPVASPSSENERSNQLAALYRSAEQAQLRGSYMLANRLLNEATALVNTPQAHHLATTMAKQATRLLANGVETICKMNAMLQTTADLLAMEQIEVMATLANIEGDLLSLSYRDKLGLHPADLHSKVVKLGTAVANLVIGTPYRHTQIASEVISLGERLFGSVWVDALLRA